MSDLATTAPAQRVLTIPNVLTLLRLILIPFFLLASLHGEFTQALVIFVAAALTDVIDGFVARTLNQRSRIGAILDPAADKTMMICGYLYYTLAANVGHTIPQWLTLVIFVRDILIVSFAYLLYTRVQVTRFPPSWAGKASTVLQAVALAFAVAENGWAPSLQPAAQFFFRLALAATLYSGFDYMRRGGKLVNEFASRQS
jgi:cardiolipin synthase